MNQKNLGPFLINPEQGARLEWDVDFPKGCYVPDAEDVAAAMADAERMNENMRRFGTIDVPGQTATGRSRNRLGREVFDRAVLEVRAKIEHQAAKLNRGEPPLRPASDFSAEELRALQQAFDAADPYAAWCRLNTRDEPFTWFHVVGLLLGVALIALGVAL